jgi:hypothetical protein
MNKLKVRISEPSPEGEAMNEQLDASLTHLAHVVVLAARVASPDGGALPAPPALLGQLRSAADDAAAALQAVIHALAAARAGGATHEAHARGRK